MTMHTTLKATILLGSAFVLAVPCVLLGYAAVREREL
jgi:hypothetical protein